MFNPCPKPEPKEKKLPKPLKRSPLKRAKEYRIPKRSEKEKVRMSKYLKLRLEYLNEHPVCEVNGCNASSTTIHHKKGRLSENLFNHFLACCMSCHNYIELNPDFAKENGYSLSRLNKKND